MKIFNLSSNKLRFVKLAFLVIPLMPVVSSCSDDFLEKISETSVDESASFDTPALVLSQVNGLYTSLKHGRLLGGRYQIFNDVRAEEFVNRASNAVTALQVYNHTAGADESYIADLWSRGYLTINRTNHFLQGLEENADKVDATLAAQYAAEAKFIRATSYFYLVQMFAKPYAADNGASPGLPLRLQAESTSANNDMARSTVAEIYTQILKDLNEAEAALPGTYATPALNVTRAHKSTVIALKTRVYLVMGNYSKVIEEGNKIVSETGTFKAPATIDGVTSVQHQLQSTLASVFSTSAPAAANTEAIFVAPFSTNDVPGTQNQLGFYYNAGNVEYYLNANTGILANQQFTSTDARRTALTTTYNLGSTASPNNVQILTKYSAVSPYTTWVPLIRYAEVLLNLAEAEARVGSQIRALELLLAVHHRSDPTWVYVPTSQTNLVDAILTERRIELLGEGFRSNDILRLNQSIMSRGAGSATTLATIAPTDSRYILAIPTTETNANSAL